MIANNVPQNYSVVSQRKGGSLPTFGRAGYKSPKNPLPCVLHRKSSRHKRRVDPLGLLCKLGCRSFRRCLRDQRNRDPSHIRLCANKKPPCVLETNNALRTHKGLCAGKGLCNLGCADRRAYKNLPMLWCVGKGCWWDNPCFACTGGYTAFVQVR